MSSPPRKRAKLSQDDGCNDSSDLPVMQKQFQMYSAELTAQQDRHERLVKLSRDLTVVGKRSIFILQRVHLNSKESCLKSISEAREKLESAGGLLLSKIWAELHGVPQDLHRRACSPGIQEFVEAIALLHFVEMKSLVSRDACNAFIQTAIGQQQSESVAVKHDQFCISVDDYVLGVGDVSGEVMRLAINSASKGDCEAPFQICAFVRTLYEELSLQESLATAGTWKYLQQKINTMRETLTKLERACYSLKVRGTEVPGHMMGDLFHAPAAAKVTEDD